MEHLKLMGLVAGDQELGGPGDERSGVGSPVDERSGVGGRNEGLGVGGRDEGLWRREV